ncbi:MAG: hypothetical protein E7B88_04215 [Finegoldia magna]|nr:hypothetical protein [Finegoldia magna]
MITVKSKKELVGKNILMNGDWFSPEHIVEYEIEKITDVVNDRIETSQSAPYGSTNSTDLESLVNNYETLKKDLLERFDRKKLSPDTIVKIEFFDNYKCFVRIDPINRIEDMISDIVNQKFIDDGFFESGKLLITKTVNIDLITKFIHDRILSDWEYNVDLEPLLDPITTKTKDYTVIISPSPRLDVKNQITVFDGNEPIGHINCKTNEEVKSWLKILETEYQL